MKNTAINEMQRNWHMVLHEADSDSFEEGELEILYELEKYARIEIDEIRSFLRAYLLTPTAPGEGESYAYLRCRVCGGNTKHIGYANFEHENIAHAGDCRLKKYVE